MCTQCSINTGLIPPVFAWLHVASAASAMRRLATTYRRGGSASCRLNRFCRISCRCCFSVSPRSKRVCDPMELCPFDRPLKSSTSGLDLLQRPLYPLITTPSPSWEAPVLVILA
ncbi:hypothetical protein J3E68DRAFT_391030 [Trichoderma sp. SZMC 28012]